MNGDWLQEDWGRLGGARRRLLRLFGLASVLLALSTAAGCTLFAGEVDPMRQGRALYGTHCVSCHGAGGDRIPAVPLNSRDYMGRLGQSGAARVINDGKKDMPAFGRARGGPLRAEEARAIAGYLDSYLGLSADRKSGRELFTTACVPCHGKQGDLIAGTPLNSSAYLAKLDTGLAEVISRGKGSMPAMGKDREGPLSSAEIAAIVSYLGMASAPSPTARPGSNPAGFRSSGAVAPVAASTAPAKAGSGVTWVEPTRTPPAEVPHAVKGVEDQCLACHGREGFSAVPVSHAGRTNTMCLMCHMTRATGQ